MDRDPRTRGEHQLDAPAAQLAGQAVAVHQHGGRLLAARGELDPVDLLRIEVRRPVARLQPKGAEGARHEEAVAVAHHGAEAGVAGGGPAGPQTELLDLLDREALRAPAGRDRDALVLEEAGHGVAVDEHDAGEPALAAAEEDARHRRAMSAGSARVQISHPVATRCWKASVRPSGDQAGWVAGAGAVVSSIGAGPSA